MNVDEGPIDSVISTISFDKTQVYMYDVPTYNTADNAYMF